MSKYSRVSDEPHVKIDLSVDFLLADIVLAVSEFVEPRCLSGAELAFVAEMDAITERAEFDALIAEAISENPATVPVKIPAPRPLWERLGLSKTVQRISAPKSPESYAAKGFEGRFDIDGLVSNLTTPTNPLSSFQKNTLSPSLYTPARTPWEALSTDDKLQAVFLHSAQRNAVAFSLNFTSKKAVALQRSGDPVRSLSRALNRASQIVLGYLLPVAFILEHTATERLHIHGCAILQSVDSETIKLLRRVLKAAGGKVRGLGSGRQCDVREMHNSTGWHGYCAKACIRTRQLLGTDKITFVSMGLRRETEASYRR